MLCVVTCCVGAQGVVLSVERTLSGRHFHLVSVHPQTSPASDLDGHRYPPEIFDPSSDSALNHREILEHDHGLGTHGVINLTDGSGASSPNPHASLIRSACDLGCPVAVFEFSTHEPWKQAWADNGDHPFDSHVTPPLERPPQG